MGVGEADPLLRGLNSEQLEAVLHGEGPLLVVAGAGSGKTRVLTHRIAHLVGRRGVPSSGICAITFTNKAAGEMRSRVESLLGAGTRGMWLSTFHSACVRILRAYGDRIGYRSSFTIYDDSDQRRLISHLLTECNLDPKRLPPRTVQGIISAAKGELVSAREMEERADGGLDREVARVYRIYQERCLAANALDFDDLIMATVKLLRSDPEVLGHYQERFHHLLVDEYQDTNHAQNELVLLLGKARGNVCVVGDSDQSIYRFRGADIRNILEFERAFPDATVIRLERNYRSTPVILDAANALIANNARRVPKDLWTEQPGGVPIRLYRAEDEKDEAAWVAAELRRLVRDEGLAYDQAAVFYRTHAQSRALEEAFVVQGVPYQVVGGLRFYDRREVKDVLAYLRVLVNMDDEVSLRRVLNVPRRGIGDSTLERLSSYALAEGKSLGAALGLARDAGVAKRASEAIGKFLDLLEELRRVLEAGTSPRDLVEQVVVRSGYREATEAEGGIEAEGRLENLVELSGVAAQFEDLDEFLSSVSLMGAIDEAEMAGPVKQAERGVSLMTLHTAKGLEYPVVFLVGLEDGVFPHVRALDDRDELEEERRLAYVGITRARQRLYLVHAWSRVVWGAPQYGIPSRFLKELPSELIEEV